MRRLTVREYSSSELVGYLRRKGVSQTEAREVVTELEQQGLIDAGRYSGVIARSEMAKGKGPVAIAAKLRRRGIAVDPAQARQLYRDHGGTEVEAIRQVLLRRYSGVDMDDRVAVAKLQRSLMRRGFSPSAIREAIAHPAVEPDFFSETD